MKKSKIGIIAVVIVALILIAGVVFFLSKDKVAIRKNLDLGNKYLNEHDYNQAIVAFTKVLTIDSRNSEAVEGTTVAYIGLADGYLAGEQYSEAVDILNEGIALFESLGIDAGQLVEKKTEIEKFIEAMRAAEEAAQIEAEEEEGGELFDFEEITICGFPLPTVMPEDVAGYLGLPILEWTTETGGVDVPQGVEQYYSHRRPELDTFSGNDYLGGDYIVGGIDFGTYREISEYATKVGVGASNESYGEPINMSQFEWIKLPDGFQIDTLEQFNNSVPEDKYSLYERIDVSNSHVGWGPCYTIHQKTDDVYYHISMQYSEDGQLILFSITRTV